MCHQTNLRFYNDIAYDNQYKGLILDGYEGKPTHESSQALPPPP